VNTIALIKRVAYSIASYSDGFVLRVVPDRYPIWWRAAFLLEIEVHQWPRHCLSRRAGEGISIVHPLDNRIKLCRAVGVEGIFFGVQIQISASILDLFEGRDSVRK